MNENIENMLVGKLYDPADSELVALRADERDKGVVAVCHVGGEADVTNGYDPFVTSGDGMERAMAGLNETPNGERVHIGFFGVRNAGKSSLVNAVCGQELAVVSDTPGTTTDPVRKAMELAPMGPVVIVDTPGIDDEGELGELRVEKARQALRRCDVAVLVTDATRGRTPAEDELVQIFEQRGVPYVVALSKADLLGDSFVASHPPAAGSLYVSSKTGEGVRDLKELVARSAKDGGARKRIVADLVEPGDVVVLVVPIDESAPRGRLILPQQMVIRDILDAHGTCAVCQPGQLAGTLAGLGGPPRMVVTDSQAFGEVAEVVPRDVQLTSFSILMARYKGNLRPYVEGAAALSRLVDSSHVLVSEGCTHHRQCNDIGTVKIPNWISLYAGSEPEFSFTSGGDFPDSLEGVDLVVHCGGCMLNEKEMAHRTSLAREAGVPIVNYGMAIAQMHGILARSLEPFPEVAQLVG